jgi:hypothetical protein
MEQLERLEWLRIALEDEFHSQKSAAKRFKPPYSALFDR